MISGVQKRTAGKRQKKSRSKPVKLKVSRTHKPDDMCLEEWQRLLRKQYGEQQGYKLENTGGHPFFSEFMVTNPQSGRTYKVAVRGNATGDNFCSCPDFSINNLGTCKHVEFTLSRLMRKRGAKKAFREGSSLPYSEVYLRYGVRREIGFKAGSHLPDGLSLMVKKYFNNGILKEDRLEDFQSFLDATSKADGHEVRCYDDVMAFIAEHQDAAHRRGIVEAEIGDGIESDIFSNILKTPLYPFQREGALFAVKAGRALIGDDMGLGKTVQALAAAEIMARLFNIQRALIVSPTSLKYQWKDEIERFTGRSVDVIDGLNQHRKGLYLNDSFYKIANYEQISRDIDLIKGWGPDLIILDEAQRIKNWNTRTAMSVKQLESEFAIILTGTPIENRIDELHSIMEFVDRRRLGPLYKFLHHHRIADPSGKVVGYRDLQTIRESLKDVLIRRRKSEVLKQLPERVDKNFFVPLTQEQREIHDENGDIAARLVAKWRRYKFLCEADQRRLQIALNNMRMAADNTYLVDKKTVHGPKLLELETVLRELVVEGDEKVVIFSQWLRMTELVEEVLKRNGIGYTHLNGSVPSRDRRGLMGRFKDDPACKVFLSTDAGGVGLNLQSGSTVINMDIPWNPAVLEQRIGRIHRMGQKRSVRVINFVTSSSIEERILDLLRFKKSVFAGALDEGGENIVMLGDSKLKQFMESVEAMTENLEKPDAEVAAQERREEEAAMLSETKEADMEKAVEEKTALYKKSADVSPDALGSLLINGAQFLMSIGKTLTESGQPLEKQMEALVERDGNTGKACIKIPLPEPDTIRNLFASLGEAMAMAMRKKEG